VDAARLISLVGDCCLLVSLDWFAHLADNVFLQKASRMVRSDPVKYVLPYRLCLLGVFVHRYGTLGGFWLILGLVFIGMGVFPLAVIGTMIRGLWSTLPDLIFAIALMIVPRLVGLWIVHRQSEDLE
jgi:hypothetical protein